MDGLHINYGLPENAFFAEVCRSRRFNFLGVDSRTSVERLWDDIKVEAAKWAASSKPLPEPGECEVLIRKLARSLQLPDDIVTFYAGEFCAIVKEKRALLGDAI
jgi:hypothetical protein